MDVIKTDIEEMDLKFVGEIEDLKQVDLVVEGKVEDLEIKLLGEPAREAMPKSPKPEGEEGADAEDAVEIEEDQGSPGVEGELEKAINLLASELRDKITAVEKLSEAKVLELHDDVTKERKDAEEKIEIKIETIQLKSMDNTLLAEEQGIREREAMAQLIKDDGEKREAAVNQRSDEILDSLTAIKDDATATGDKVTQLEADAAKAKEERSNTAEAVSTLDKMLLKAVETLEGSLKEEASKREEGIKKNEEETTKLQGSIAEEVGKLEGSLESIDGRLKEIETKNEAQDGATASLTEKVTKLEGDVVTLEGSLREESTKREEAINEETSKREEESAARDKLAHELSENLAGKVTKLEADGESQTESLKQLLDQSVSVGDKVLALETALESSSEAANVLGARVGLVEKEAEETEQRLNEKITKSTTTFLDMFCTKQQMDAKDEFRKQYVDDMVAKGNEEAQQGREKILSELRAEISESANTMAEKFTTEDYVNERNVEIRQYVDSRVESVAPSA